MKKLAFSALLTFALAHAAHAIVITAGPTLTNTTISSENPVSTSSSTVVQFTTDVAGTVELDFFQVSSVDSSLTSVATLIRTFAGGGPQSVSWDAMWLIGAEFGRHNGTYVFQVLADNTLPPLGDPSSKFTINSVDIHGLATSPSFDAAHQPTFPYLISYQLAKTSIVTATIMNSSQTVVRTLLPAQRVAGENITSTATLTWNGLADDNTPVPIGTYTLKMNATDPDTQEAATERTATLDVLSLAGSSSNPQKLFEDNVYVYPNPVRNSAATFHMSAIRAGANLSLKIYTLTGDLVLEQTFPGVPEGNVKEYPWLAVNQSGHKVGRGLYYYVVREEDSVGTLQTVKKFAVLP